MDNQTDPLLTPREAADLLNVPTHRIRIMIHRNQLPALKVGTHWRIPKTELAKLIRRPEKWLTFTLVDGKWDIQLCLDNAKPLTSKGYRLSVRVSDELIGEVAAAEIARLSLLNDVSG